jgi:hypothetical protein
VTLGQGKPAYVPGTGGGGAPPGTQVKELWFEFEGQDSWIQDYYSAEDWNSSNDVAMSIVIPDDFNALVEASVHAILKTDAVDRTVDIDSQYGQDGDLYNANTESDSLSGITIGNDDHMSFSVASILTGISAGDRCSIYLDMTNSWGSGGATLGFLLRYT